MRQFDVLHAVPPRAATLWLPLVCSAYPGSGVRSQLPLGKSHFAISEIKVPSTLGGGFLNRPDSAGHKNGGGAHPSCLFFAPSTDSLTTFALPRVESDARGPQGFIAARCQNNDKRDLACA